MPKNFKELKVWHKSYRLCLEIYGITAKSPKDERYGLTSQIKRSVVSIPSDIAEIERMLKALMKYPAASSGVSSKALSAPRGGVLNPGFAIKFLENNPLNPWALFSN